MWEINTGELVVDISILLEESERFLATKIIQGSRDNKNQSERTLKMCKRERTQRAVV